MGIILKTTLKRAWRQTFCQLGQLGHSTVFAIKFEAKSKFGQVKSRSFRTKIKELAIVLPQAALKIFEKQKFLESLGIFNEGYKFKGPIDYFGYICLFLHMTRDVMREYSHAPESKISDNNREFSVFL